MKDTSTWQEGDTVSFKYRSRSVNGTVKKTNDKIILVILSTPYIGKNEEWEAGETKVFFRKLIK